MSEITLAIDAHLRVVEKLEAERDRYREERDQARREADQWLRGDDPVARDKERYREALEDVTARAWKTIPARYSAGSPVDHLIASLHRADQALEGDKDE